MPHSTALSTIPVPGTSAPLHALKLNGRPMVSLRHACEALGVDAEGQRRKLKAKSWAVAEIISATGSDGKTYQMTMIDRRTFTMWLATIDTSRISKDALPIVEVFQAEAADALDSYFHDGGAINPRATVDQLDVLANRARVQMDIIRLADGIIDSKHLEAKARIVLANAMGETPELATADVPLYVSDFLKSKGLGGDMVKAKASGFGRRLKGLYISEHGDAPSMAHQNLPNGQVREVCAYTESDRPLFEQVWVRHYEGVTKAVAA